MSMVEDAQESANFPASHLLSLGCHLGLPLSLPWCVVAGISDPLYLPSFQPSLSWALPAPQTLGFQSHSIFCHGHPKDETPPGLPPRAPQPCHTLAFPFQFQGSKRLCPPTPRCPQAALSSLKCLGPQKGTAVSHTHSKQQLLYLGSRINNSLSEKGLSHLPGKKTIRIIHCIYPQLLYRANRDTSQ